MPLPTYCVVSLARSLALGTPWELLEGSQASYPALPYGLDPFGLAKENFSSYKLSVN